MKRPVVIWILALVVTLSSAVWQRMTGPTYAARGKAEIGGEQIRYRLGRSHALPGGAPVQIAAPAGVTGHIEWRRYPTQEDWQTIPLQREDGWLRATLPPQPPAGKVEYIVTLAHNGQSTSLLQGAPVRLRYRGGVPAPVLVLHVIGMFLGMLLSARAGLGALLGDSAAARWVLPTLLLLTLGGMILGPVVQKYAFDAYWTGWPLGTDLTDNKTAVAWLAWLVAWRRPSRGWLIAAAGVTLIIFGIPHSMFGSQLDYNS